MYEPPNLGMHISVNRPVKQDYSGPRNEKSGMSEGLGSVIYNRDDYMQNYEGNFISNNTHGYGEYHWQPPKYKYEGQFYVNKKEGYGRLSYPSGAYFEGLYRNDQRFGPGVYTDPAGYQDVGIWVGSKLVRLSRTFEPDHVMPRLAITDEDRIRLLRYRQIIHLDKDKIKPLPENLLESLTHFRNYDKSVLARAGELYNQLCRDDRAPSFNTPRYNETFFGSDSDHLTIDVLMTEEEIQQKIAAEGEAMEMKSPLESFILKMKKSNIVHEVHERDNVRIHKQYISQMSQQDENHKEETEPDYCGIKQIHSGIMNDTLLMTNHEEQWNIFQTSSIAIPKDSRFNYLKKKLGTSLNEENLHSVSETVSYEVEFDDFGRKKINDLQLTKKVVVTDLMAWNNSPMSIELLRHVFKHRNFEKKLSFDISKILAGRRASFRQEGTREKAALELLAACSSGFRNTVLELISRQNVDADLADNRGNTGLLFAAAGDSIEIIDALLNLGANVDSINDECLTPLSLCILRLLESIHGVTNWSKAFLPNTIISEQIVDDESMVFKKLEQWHGRVSYESLVQQLPKRMDRNPSLIKNDSGLDSKDFGTERESAIGDATNTIIESKPDKRVTRKLEQHLDRRGNYDSRNNVNGIPDKTQTQKYIFDLSPITGTPSPWKKFKNNKTRNRNNKMKDKKSKDLIKSSRSEELFIDPSRMQEINELSSKKEKVSATISKLLQRGADPNFAQVPCPVLIMAIFTKITALVSQLLQYGADPDTTLSKANHSLTPLLILAVLKPAYEHALMAKALLNAKADPSIRADPQYRSDVLERVKQNRLPEFLDHFEGLTALHILAIRPDMDSDVNEYLGELIRVIHRHGCIKRSDLYQGHSPLSLAILEGNLSAVKTFLRTTSVNVNEQLGLDLGSALLMLESCVLQELLPPDLLQEFLELLLEYGGCPFASAKVGNCVTIPHLCNLLILRKQSAKSSAPQVLEEEYNQIEYGRKELAKLSSPTETKVDVKEMKKRSKSKGSKSSKTPDARNFTNSMEFVEKYAREKLIKRIQANFVKELLASPIMLLPVEKRSEFLDEPIFKNALTWMTGKELAIVMKTMNCSRGNVRELVRLFVKACVSPRQITSSELHALIRNETEEITNKVMPPVDGTNEIETAADIKIERDANRGETKSFKPAALRRPESDLDDDRFKVCFECLAVHGKVLILCPRCERVYFCSQECNAKSIARETNLHRCPVFYRTERIGLEKIATSLRFDPTTYIPRIFRDPETLVVKTGRHHKSTGKNISKNGNDNTYADTPRCKHKNSTAYDDDAGSHVAAKNGDSARETKVKQEKGNGQSQTEDDDNLSAKSKKQRKNKEDKNSGDNDIKSNKKKAGYLFGNEVDPSGNIKQKTMDKKGHRSETNGDEKDTFDKIDLKKGIKKSGDKGERRGKETKVDDEVIKSKEGNKNRYGVNRSDENKTGSRKGRKEDPIVEEGGGNSVKLKRGKKKGGELGEGEDDNESKFKSKKKGKKGAERSNELIDSKDDRQKTHEARRNDDVVASKNRLNKEMKEIDSNKRYKSDKRYVETNVSNKYLDWLLKVSRSAGEHLDIDMLLMPYVVFAQGDTYFRILSGNEYPKFAGNYSLI